MLVDPEDFAASNPPSAIYCVHAAYESRIRELGRLVPATPSYFLKPLGALSRGGPVSRPLGTEYLCFEGEMALLIGERIRNVDQTQAQAAVAGVAAANDFGLHDLIHVDGGSLLRDKGHDGFCPIGNWIMPVDDASMLRTVVDGVERQSAAIGEMVFDPGYLVADLARFTTLNAGDIVLTGTPAGSRPVEPGSTVTVSLDERSMVSSTVVVGDAVRFDGGAAPADTAQARLLALAKTPQ
jgi:5-oxopent-3-ene-1,2,5-tricarboxylate decarboxylase/2-hydroxyhepta-2,4-diene-1,7-dioate isomerase